MFGFAGIGGRIGWLCRRKKGPSKSSNAAWQILSSYDSYVLLCAALCCLVAKSDASSMSATFLAQHLQYFLHANDMVKWFRRNRARANKNSRSRCSQPQLSGNVAQLKFHARVTHALYLVLGRTRRSKIIKVWNLSIFVYTILHHNATMPCQTVAAKSPRL